MSLKIERIKKGITQWRFAQKLGIDNTKLSKIENGRVKPDKKLKTACSRILKVPISTLFPSQMSECEEITGKDVQVYNDFLKKINKGKRKK